MRLAFAGMLIALVACTSSDPVTTTRSALVTPTYVRSAWVTPQSPQTSASVTLSSQTAGDLNVVMIGWFNATSTISTLTDTAGNTYQLAVGPTVSPGVATLATYYAKNIRGGTDTVTITFSSAAPSIDLRVAEYAGVDQAAPFDVGAGSIGTGTSCSSGALTTHAANDLIVSGNYNQTFTTGPGAGYTQRFITTPCEDIWQDKVAAAAGSETATAPLGQSGWWIMQAAAFKAAPNAVDGGAGAGGAGGAAGASGAGGGGTGGGGTGGKGGAAGSAGTGGAGGTGGTGGGSSPASFPLVYAADHRTLQDQAGRPFPILGRSSWGVITLSAADARTYLDDCAAKGFNSIEVGIIWRHPRTNAAPRAGNGELPFLKRLDGAAWTGSLGYSNINAEAPDFTTPNPAYWSFVDGFLADALARGISVMMFPAYAGFAAGPEGWMAEMAANGSTRTLTYGRFIAERYKGQANLVWMAGGDYGSGSFPFTAAQQAAEQGLLFGINSTPGRQSPLWSAEWNTESTASFDQSAFGAMMTLNGAYSFNGDVVTQGRRAYGFTPSLPAFLLEEPYDEEGPDGVNVNSNATQPVRRFEWWGWLTTVGGYMAGNGYVWPFNVGWQNHLDTQAATDLARLNGFVRSLAWWRLVPDGAGLGTLITSGAQSGTQQVTAAAAPDGTLLVAYVPPAHTGTITVDMSKLSATATARWFNPTTAGYSTIGSFANTGTRVFTPPGDNGTGFTDWTLILTVP